MAFVVPSIEHLFEYTILKNFLNNQSLTKEEFEYFEDFHVLVKEDLLEYFQHEIWNDIF